MIYQLVNILSIKNIRFKTSMLRSDFCDYSDAYIVVKRTITVEGNNVAKTRNKKFTFKDMLHFDHAYQKSVTHL